MRVALDDYGTGFSSLSDVAALPVDELKIDPLFVAGLGRALGITVVAEGVENAVRASALRSLGCEFGQGFHFGSPRPAGSTNQGTP